MAGGWTVMAPFKIKSTQASTTRYNKRAAAYTTAKVSLIAKNAKRPYPKHGRKRCRVYVYVWFVSQSEIKNRKPLAE